jgi:hypothetical protein
MCVTGLSVHHVGERFQRSNETISKYVGISSVHYFLTSLNRYFRHILDIVSSTLFYTKWVMLPTIDDPVPPHILENPKWFPFFENAIGAMDATHIDCCPSAADRAASHNRKGGISMNTICSCPFFMECGWEGSAADSAIYDAAQLVDLTIPEDTVTTPAPSRAGGFFPRSLALLFGGVVPRAVERPRQTQFTEERLYMELLAAEETDEDPSDGALSGSGDEYKD